MWQTVIRKGAGENADLFKDTKRPKCPKLWCPFLQTAPRHPSKPLCPAHHWEQGRCNWSPQGIGLNHWSCDTRQQCLILEKLSHLTNPILFFFFFLPDFDVLKNLSPTGRSRVRGWGQNSKQAAAAAAIFQHISNHLPWGELIFASLEPDMNLWCWAVPFAAAPNLFWPGFCGNH